MARLFVAIDLPDCIKDQLAGVQNGIPDARWVKRQQLHLTLRFIGDVDATKTDQIKAALSGIKVEAFTLKLHGVGQFPARGKPRVLWVGMEDNPTLVKLHQKIETSLGSMDIKPGDHAFSPHITLARLKKPPDRKAIDDFLAKNRAFMTVQIMVSEFVLFSSELSPQGPLYTQLAVYPLLASRL